MTPFHWALTATGAAILAAGVMLLVYDVLAMQWGWRTLSVRWSEAHRLLVFAGGLGVGFVLGVVCGHLWWPIARP